MAERGDDTLDAIERHIEQTIAQIAEARRRLKQGAVPDMGPVQEPLRQIENWFACRDKQTRRQLAGALIGLHEEIEGMVAELAAAKQSVETDLHNVADHERAHRAYGGEQRAGRPTSPGGR